MGKPRIKPAARARSTSYARIAHRDHSSPIDSLAVWHEDHSILPAQVFDTHLVEFSLIPHSGVTHQDDNIAEKVTSSWSPLAIGSSHNQFFFCFVVKPKVSPMRLNSQKVSRPPCGCSPISQS